MEKTIIIPDIERLERIKKAISADGKDKFHVVSDFDRTLTKAFVNGKEVLSVISVLRNGDYITPEYRAKATLLANVYKPIEYDPKLSIEEKKPKMQNWWREHFELLIESKLNRKVIEEVVRNREFEFRKGTLEFLSLLHKNKIPMIILSASGLGDAIPMYLRQNDSLYENIHVITNGFVFDKDGYATEVKKPIITSMNKDEGELRKHPVFKKIQDRRNVVLLGNNVADLKMLEGFDCKNLIKIGYLNENVEENIEEFKKNYDVIITGDGDMSYANTLVKEMFG